MSEPTWIDIIKGFAWIAFCFLFVVLLFGVVALVCSYLWHQLLGLLS